LPSIIGIVSKLCDNDWVVATGGWAGLQLPRMMGNTLVGQDRGGVWRGRVANPEQTEELT